MSDNETTVTDAELGRAVRLIWTQTHALASATAVIPTKPPVRAGLLIGNWGFTSPAVLVRDQAKALNSLREETAAATARASLLANAPLVKDGWGWAISGDWLCLVHEYDEGPVYLRTATEDGWWVDGMPDGWTGTEGDTLAAAREMAAHCGALA